MTVTRPIVRYHGGKFRLAPWIVSNLPAHRIYVEPFGGGASVLLRKPRSYAEVYNDRWSEIHNVFRVVRDHGAELQRRIHLTPFGREEFEDDSEPIDEIDQARKSIFRSFAGFGSAAMNNHHQTGLRASSYRNGTIPAHDWANYSAHIGAFVERLRGVVIENRDACELIPAHDSRSTLYYVDPPYVHATRNMVRRNASYAFEMSDDEHRRLAAVLHQVQGMVVLSGYPCDLYDRDLYPEWKRIEREAMADGARPRTEVLWFNPAAWTATQSQQQTIAGVA
jgi:DNA adenine methylase